jgi:hypothetical protein
MSDTVVVDRQAAVATITLNDPDQRNAMTHATKEALVDAVTDVGADEQIRAVVLTGAGSAFCVGQDLEEHVVALDGGASEAFATVADELPNAYLAMVGGYHSPEAWYTDGNYPIKVKNLVENLGVGDRILWSGEYEWDSDAPSEYLHASDVVVLPFDSGVFLHNSSFAAVASHGLPTIATRGADTDDAIVDGRNVHMIPPRDVAGLTDALRFRIRP